MNSSLRIATQLLAVERRKGSRQFGRIKVSPVVVAVCNLFYCGYYDQFLRNDVDGHYLTLFFFIEASLCFLFTIGFLVQRVEEVVVKTTIFPTTSLSRLFFTIMSTIGRPLLVALVATTGIFLVIFYRHDMLVALYAACIFSFMIASIVVLSSVVFLLSRESIQRIAGVTVGIMFFMIAVPIGTVIFNLTPLLSAVPIVSWSAAGILAMQHADYGAAMVYVAIQMFIIASGVLIGRKVA